MGIKTYKITAAQALWIYYNEALGLSIPMDAVIELIDAGVELIQELNK